MKVRTLVQVVERTVTALTERWISFHFSFWGSIGCQGTYGLGGFPHFALAGSESCEREYRQIVAKPDGDLGLHYLIIDTNYATWQRWNQSCLISEFKQTTLGIPCAISRTF